MGPRTPRQRPREPCRRSAGASVIRHLPGLDAERHSGTFPVIAVAISVRSSRGGGRRARSRQRRSAPGPSRIRPGAGGIGRLSTARTQRVETGRSGQAIAWSSPVPPAGTAAGLALDRGSAAGREHGGTTGSCRSPGGGVSPSRERNLHVQSRARLSAPGRSRRSRRQSVCRSRLSGFTVSACRSIKVFVCSQEHAGDVS